MKSLRFAAIALLAVIPLTACDDEGNGGVTPPPVVIVGTVSGTVSVEGTGLAGVTVSLVGAASQSATTAAGGTYLFANVPAGTHGVQISGQPADVTFASTSTVVTISTSGQVVTADFSGNYIRTSSIRGSITSGTGAGIVATVELAGTGMLAGESRAGGSDPNGNFEFTGLRAGDYTVTISEFGTATFTVTSRDVTVAVGQSANVSFVGTVEEVTTAATVTISSITVAGLGTTVIAGAVVGAIDVNLTIDEGTETITEAAVLLDGVVVGTQSFTTGAPAEDGPEAATRTATIQINTAAHVDGTVAHTNGDKVVSAQVTTTDGAVATASSSVNLKFVNADLLIGTLSAVNSAVSAASQLWHGGDVTVGVTPVPYSGKTVGSISVTLVQDPSAPTATVVSEDTAPFSFVFSADCEEPDELCLWQSDTADPDNLNITAAAYADGSTFALGVVGDPNAFSKIDGASPLPQLYDNIPPEFEPGEVFALPEAVANGTEICCDNGWMMSSFPFDDALGDTEDDDTPGAGGMPGVGGVMTTFHAGAASLDDDELEALPDAATPGAGGLSSSLLNNDYEVRVGLWDALNNVEYFGLTGNGTNGIDFFGIDDSPGTHELRGVPDMTIYGSGSASLGGVTFSSLVEDVSGFGAEPVSGSMTIDPVPDALDGPYVIAGEEEDGGAINLTAATPACGALAPSAQDMSAVNCIPDGTAGVTMDGVYTFTGTLFNQAGGLSTPQTVRILHDLTNPLITANVSLQPVLTGGSPATFSGAVSDNHELASTSLTFDYNNDGDWLSYGPDAPIGDGDPWDGAYTTTANPSVTVNLVAGVQAVDPTTSLPTGSMLIMTNVRIIAHDIAGNSSPLAAAPSNNINPGTIDPLPADYSGAGILAPGWLITEPAAAVSICNGEDPGAEEDCEDDLGLERTVDIEVEVTGVSGSFPNPFLNGRIYFYMVDPITSENNLLADLAGNAATLSDVGVRTYQWTYTLTLADVTEIADGTTITVFAIGVSDDGEGLRLESNSNITVEDGL